MVYILSRRLLKVKGLLCRIIGFRKYQEGNRNCSDSDEEFIGDFDRE